jgi:hypothetical protein
MLFLSEDQNRVIKMKNGLKYFPTLGRYTQYNIFNVFYYLIIEDPPSPFKTEIHHQDFHFDALNILFIVGFFSYPIQTPKGQEYLSFCSLLYCIFCFRIPSNCAWNIMGTP